MCWKIPHSDAGCNVSVGCQCLSAYLAGRRPFRTQLPLPAGVQRPRLLPSQKVRALPRLSAEDLVFTSTVSVPVFLPLLFQTSFIDIVFTYLKIHPFKVYSSALAGGSVGWLIISYAKRLRGSIPSQGTYLGCSFNPWLKCVQETTNCVSHINVSLSLSNQ